MTKKLALFIASVALACMPMLALAQVDCNAVVIADEAGVLANHTYIDQQAAKLVDQGVDPHVVTVASMAKYGPTLEDAAENFALACGWTHVGHGTNFGAAKPNLLLLVVAPHERKKNAFFGAALAPAFESRANVDFIYSQAANPYFKQGDFNAGLGVALADFSAKNAAYHDQQKHPAQTTINNAATDFTGLWTTFKWVLSFVVLGFVVWMLIMWFRFRKHDEDAIKAAQGDAIDARTRATNIFNSLPAETAEQAKEFAELSNTVKNDPTVDGLDEAEYRRIQRAWDEFYNDIAEHKYVGGIGSAASVASVKHSEYPPARHHHSQPVAEPAAPAAATAAPTVINTSNGGDNFLTGMLLGDVLSQHESEPSEPTRVHEAPSYEASSRDDDDASVSSGDDSSWGASVASAVEDATSSFSSGDDSSFGGGGDSDGGGDFSSGGDSSF